ncbi:hypothetical protein CYMTET_4098 [Cymbomonas tetramitiformis]|uniref:Acyl-[acyl-carrier-protein] hydrolase n=1 Tax=Cymbomonas tetramitiformis TaxID=36881 RepID=A0AAE0H3Q2_9CHLO|nr:hypothetical protein CYMTET_19589 [Cymbomonas tetramitiformis]KAK3288441.1 hypothetical protein CYMTET_4098 [Cymbomonas tetramitiformis]
MIFNQSALGTVELRRTSVDANLKGFRRKSSPVQAIPNLNSTKGVARPKVACRVSGTEQLAIETLQSGQYAFRNDGTSYSEAYRVRSYEVDARRNATLSTFARLLQETATNHALRLGFASEDGFCVDENMAANNLIWVLSKLRLQIDMAPMWGECVEVNTWFCESGRLAARRDWTVSKPEADVKVAGASSVWVLVNAETRRLSRMPESMREQYRPSCPPTPKWAIGEGEGCIKIPDIFEEAEDFSVVEGIRVRFGDVDMNQHINNVVYIEWAMESIPQDLWREGKLLEVDLEWCAEGDCEQPVDSKICVDTEASDESQVVYIHRVQHSGGGKVLFRARSTWQR